MDKYSNYIFGFLLLAFSSLCSSAESRLSDPTKPAIRVLSSQPESTVKTFRKKQSLSAIFIKGGKRQAIINDKLYQTGDIFSGKKIVAIKTNSVILKNAQGVSKLTLTQIIKKRKNP